MRTTISLLGLLLCVGLVCSEKDPVSPYPQAKKQNIDAEKLERAFTAARNDGGVASLIVARNNVIVAEELYHTEQADTFLNIFSITKSVTSILTGLAMERGHLQRVDQKVGPILQKISEHYTDRYEDLTIQHLLSMSGGWPWSELDAAATDYVKWNSSPNQVDYLLSLPSIHQPGEIFTYNSGASHLLSVILTEATNQSTREFAIEHLFTPLGISPGTWSRDKQGYYNGSSTLRLGPHALLKIGLLFLNDGTYNGQQIVPKAWVRESTQTFIRTDDAVPFGPGYGYLWWTGSQNGHNYYFANGWGGQFIVNVPDLSLTVVAQSNWTIGKRAAHEQWWNTINIIMNDILPAVNN
jgi:CubicO group peptidase (beta-lactamase class C family)